MNKPIYYILLGCFFLLWFFPSRSFAQQKDSVTIRGTIVNQKDGKPLNFATVALLRAADSSVITGKNTNNKGKFSFSVAQKADLLLRVSYMGYQDIFVPVSIAKQEGVSDMGEIKLSPFSNKLEAVTVTAEKKPMYEYKKDSTIFNVPEGFQTGGTAQDVLEFTPSLTIDADGNIMVEGESNVSVYIDNKPVSDLGFSVEEYLENTPAFMIEKVEILEKAPDPEDAAKALAAGVTDHHYINIITRKIKYRGYNAAITAGMNTHNSQTLRGRFNMNLKPFQLDYSNNLRVRTDSSYLHRISFVEDKDDSSVLDQKNYRKSTRFHHNLKARYDFKFAEKEHLRLRARLGWNNNKNQSNDLSNIVNPGDKNNQNRDQQNTNRSKGYNVSTNAEYKKEYDKKGKELRASVNLRQRNSKRNRYATGAYLIKGDTLLQQNEGNNLSRGLRSNFQYKNSFGSENKHFYQVNASFSTSNRHNLNDVSRSDTTTASSELFKNELLSTNYYSSNKDYGLLLLTGKRDKKLGWVAAASVSYKDNNNHDDYRGSIVNSHVLSSRNAIGMNYSFNEDQMLTLHLNPGFQRYEQKTVPNDSMERITYKYTNFIPGASAKYEIDKHRVSFHYDRKLRMPNWRQLNPYVDNRDPLNIRTGNPDLRPAFTNEYKLRYSYKQKIFYTSLNLTDQISKDVISSYTTVDSNGVSTRTYVNLNKRERQTAQLNAGVHYFKDLPEWDATLNLNAGGGLSAYTMQSNDEHVSKDFQDVTGLTSNFKIWTSFKYKFVSLNVNGRYYGPRYFSQGKRPSRFRSGLRAKASFLEHSFNISLGIENIFGASVKDNFYKTDRYIQYSNNRQNVRYFSLYLTYQFKDYKKLGKEEG